MMIQSSQNVSRTAINAIQENHLKHKDLLTMPRQKTLGSVVHFEGIGMHSGGRVSMSLHPTTPGSGITFVRTDVTDRDNVIPALWDRVVDTMMCTTIGNDAGVRVRTIEHLMAAFYGCEIDNVRVELDSEEVPIVDGSAEPFVRLIDEAGTFEQNAPRPLLEVKRSVSVEVSPDKWVSLHPATCFTMECHYDFGDYAELRAQSLRYDGTPEMFREQIMRSRTFGFLKEAEKLWSSGLAKGGSLDNVVVIDGSRVINKEGFRYPNECARHKVLDAVGDLYLAGAPIRGFYSGHQPGHALNNKLLRALFADPAAFQKSETRRSAPGTSF